VLFQAVASGITAGSVYALVAQVVNFGPGPLRGGLETLKGFETGFTLPTTVTATEHEGQKAARILEIQPGGKRKLLDVILRADGSVGAGAAGARVPAAAPVRRRRWASGWKARWRS
jgi:hypothetical protein